MPSAADSSVAWSRERELASSFVRACTRFSSSLCAVCSTASRAWICVSISLKPSTNTPISSSLRRVTRTE